MTETNTIKPLSPVEISSIKKQIKLLPPDELIEYLETLLKQGKIRVELVESLVEASNRVKFIYPSLLAKCIVATKSELFFDACEAKFENAPEDLISIFETFYSKTIELRLCNYFQKALQSKKPFPYFDFCIRALTKNGRELTLETLEILEFEYGPKADLAKVIRTAIQEAEGAEPLEAHEFDYLLLDTLTIHRLVEIRQAIAIVKTNMQSSPPSASFISQTLLVPGIKMPDAGKEYENVEGSFEEYARNALERSDVHRQQAEQLLSLNRFADAGNNYRKSAEAILKAVFAIRVQQTKVPNTLDRLKASFKNLPGESLPDAIGAAIEVVQIICNLASHDQSDTSFKLDDISMKTVQVALQAIASWAQSAIKS